MAVVAVTMVVGVVVMVMFVLVRNGIHANCYIITFRLVH
jgi:hypothetical protein